MRPPSPRDARYAHDVANAADAAIRSGDGDAPTYARHRDAYVQLRSVAMSAGGDTRARSTRDVDAAIGALSGDAYFRLALLLSRDALRRADRQRPPAVIPAAVTHLTY